MKNTLILISICAAAFLSSCTVSNSGGESNIVDSVVVETASDTANTVVADTMVADSTVAKNAVAEAVPDTVVIYDDDYYENAEYRDGLDVDYQSWMAYWEKRFLDRVKHHDMKYFKKHIDYPLRVGESLTLRSEKDFAAWQNIEGVKLVSGRLLDNSGHQEWLEHGEKFDTINYVNSNHQ